MTARTNAPQPWLGTQIPWVALTALVICAGITGAEWLHLTNPYRYPALVTGFMILGTVATAILVAITARGAARRAAITTELVEVLYNPLGWNGPSHGIVKPGNWQPIPPDARSPHTIYPSTIRLNFTAGASMKQLALTTRLAAKASKDTKAPEEDLTMGASPEWLSLIKTILAEQIGVTFKLKVDRRGRYLVATPAGPEPEEEAEDPRVERLRRVTTKLFGATSELSECDQNAKGRIQKFTVSHQISESLALNENLPRRIETTISKVLPGRWRGNFDLETDVATFEERPTLPKLLWPRIYPELTSLKEATTKYRNTLIYFAENEDRQPITWHPRKVPHRLIIGPTGSGKTSSIHTFITQTARSQWAVNIVDRKNIEYRGFRDWPNVQCVATRIEDQIALIHSTWVLMKQRYEASETGAARTEDFPPVLLVLDEYTELVKDIATWYAKLVSTTEDTKKWPKFLPTEEEVGSILRLGRTARIHVLIGMQRPDAKYVEGENRDNLTGRQSLGRLGRHGAAMLWDDYYTGTTIPPGLLGRGMALNDLGKPVEVQNYFTPDPYKPDDLTDDKAIKTLDMLRPTVTSHPRIVFDTPYDPHGDEQFHFDAYLNAKAYYAEDRPDLDPLSDQYRFKPSVDSGTAAAATKALGPSDADTVIVDLDTPAAATPAAPSRRTRDASRSNDKWPGYGKPIPRPIDDLVVGDLICVNAGRDEWAILTDQPEDDILDPEGSATLNVRNEDGEYDCLTVSLDAPVITRPLLDDDDESAAA